MFHRAAGDRRFLVIETGRNNLFLAVPIFSTGNDACPVGPGKQVGLIKFGRPGGRTVMKIWKTFHYFSVKSEFYHVDILCGKRGCELRLNNWVHRWVI